MKVSTHAGIRFLERVMTRNTYTSLDISFAIEYLEKVLRDVIPISQSTQFVLPGFQNFRVVYKDGNVVTIIPKDKNHFKKQ
jgi:hypothetical protein